MSAIQSLVTEHLGLWTSAIKRKSSAGRGTSSKTELYGIKKLRELILELAVRGLLVPQESNDEPASLLLKKIASEKAQAIKKGKGKNKGALPPICDDEVSFTLPKGWVWVRMGAFGDSNIGLTYKPGNVSESGVPVLRSSNIQNGKIDLSDLVRVSELDIKSTAMVETGDLIICARNGSKALVGKTAQIKSLPEPMSFGAFMAVFRSSLNNYVEVFLNSPVFRRNLDGVDTTTINQLTQSNLINTLVPVPPLAEQYRIVAKVDELMALCDQLEQQTDASLSAHQTLVETLLGTLTNAADHAQFTSAWQRFVAHFDTLFTTEYSIDQLKQTILQLAVMGKLVPQDPNDEPANSLLKKIATQKSMLAREGKIKKEKSLPLITKEEKPFEVPNGWEWARFESLTNSEFPISYGVLVPGPDIEDGVPFVRIEDLSLDNPASLPKKKISCEIDQQYSRTRLMGGEILLGVVGSIGKLGLAPFSWKGANVARAVCRIMPVDFLSKDYLVQILQSRFMQNSFKGDTRTLAQPTLNIGFIRNTLTPVPPIAEQHRIVAKVNELMAVCERLKTCLNQAQTTQLHLVDAIAEQALAV